ncbi:MAG: DUF1523 domain-containing protein, partial [Silicimonas sp.]|nr:DUF1523 domain-containing protein [Silicimonas sp.]
TILIVIFATIWRLWLNFRRARIDPRLEDMGEGIAAAQGRMGSFFDRLVGKKE